MSELLLAVRLTTREVCALARFSNVTLWRRIRAGRMPAPIDRGRELIFDKREVLIALGKDQAVVTAETPRDIADVIRQRAAELAARRGKAKGGR